MRRFPHLRGEARNNNEADLLADKARFNFYHAYHIELSQLLANRQEGYVAFMRLAHNITYRIQSAIQQVKASPAFQLHHPELTMPRFVTHAQPDHFPAESYAPLMNFFHIHNQSPLDCLTSSVVVLLRIWWITLVSLGMSSTF